MMCTALICGRQRVLRLYLFVFVGRSCAVVVDQVVSSHVAQLNLQPCACLPVSQQHAFALALIEQLPEC